MKEQISKVFLCLCCVMALPTWKCAADSVTLISSSDTFINSGVPDNNAGSHVWLDSGMDRQFGVRRGLIRFDLSEIPAGATITSAVLMLQVSRVPPGAGSSSFTLYRVTADWGEGTKTGNNGAPATAGEATWNARRFLAADWASPGGKSDLISEGSGSAIPDAAAASRNDWRAPGLISDVQYWLTNQAGNFGWMLVCDNEGTPGSVLGFATREAGAAGPSLEIGFARGAASNSPPLVSIISPTNGASFTAPAKVTIEAVANDLDGTISKVEFLDNNNSLGVAASSPYSISANLFPGLHVLTCAATDNANGVTTSSNATIRVNNLAISNPIPSLIPKGDITAETETIADGMASPLGMTTPDDGTGRMFVYDQGGKVWVVTKNGRLNAPLLDVTTRLVLLGAYDERGLLGLAAHPDFAQKPLIYTYTSEPSNGAADFQIGVNKDHQSVITEWRISASNSNLVDLSSAREVLRIDEPQPNHNGGTMRFGPDGFLYVALGDGGLANDVGPGHLPGGNAQNLDVILGKIIRVDIDGRNSANGKYGVPGNNPFLGLNALPEIYAYGLRNPLGFSFDRTSGQLLLGDVGQNKVEEVDIITSGGNYGWNLKEGSFWFDAANGSIVTAPISSPPRNLLDPIAQYDHDDGNAVIGGYVYRGSAIPGLTGRYVFGDWGSVEAPSGRLFFLDGSNAVSELQIGADDRRLGLWIKGFGEGSDGELYLFGSRWLGPSGNTGRMLKLIPAPEPMRISSLSMTNTNFHVSWSGGGGPFVLERNAILTNRSWCQADVSLQRSATAEKTGDSCFLRVVDAKHIPRVPLTACLSSASEHPPNNSTATGLGLFALDGNTLTFNLNYSGLSATATAGHVHGPADTSTNAPVIVDLAPFNGGGWGATGTVSGVIVLTDEEKTMLLAGKTYVNVRTEAIPGGEIRGQIAPANMEVALSGANEVDPVATSGNGLGNLVLVGNRLTFNITYQHLSGAASDSYMQGPATTAQNAEVLTNLTQFNGGSYGMAGNLSGTLILSPSQLNWLIDGLTYIGFRTPTHPDGEIRGQILPKVSGVPLTVMLSGYAEQPALTNSANGTGTLSLSGNQLAFNIEYSGLSGGATAAHLHGPGRITTNAGVMIDLSRFNGEGFGTSGVLSGVVELTAGQRDFVLGGQTYINFQTSSHPGGELRGQLAPVVMSAGINGANETPTPVLTTGTGTATFSLVRDQLSMCVAYHSLLSPAIASHIQGPAGFTDNGAVLLGLTPLNDGEYDSSGALTGTVRLEFAALAAVLDGKAYINFNTTNSPAGEIRGQLLR